MLILLEFELLKFNDTFALIFNNLTQKPWKKPTDGMIQ